MVSIIIVLVLMSVFFEGDGGSIVEVDYESGRFNGFKGFFVLSIIFE